MMTDFTFSTASGIVFGPGQVREVGTRAAALGSSVLLVTGRGSLKRSGRLAEIVASLRESSLDVTVFDETPPEPTVAVVRRGIEVCYSHRCDVVVAVGGGSVIDVGKAVASLAGAPGDVREYLSGRELESRGCPFIAVPTTAGSGSEVTPNTVLTDSESGVKASIRSPYMFPDAAIVDPELTLSLPPDATAFSGMDALSQALEANVSRGSNPLTDALSGDAAVRLIRSLPLAYADGTNLDHRTEVALGSLMGGIALANARLGLVHGVAHPLGVATGLPHGLICALLLPHVMRFNMPVSAPRYARLAREMGISSSESDDRAALDLLDSIEALNRSLGIEQYRSRTRVSVAVGVGMVSQVLASGSTKSNPRPVTEQDVLDLLSAL